MAHAKSTLAETSVRLGLGIPEYSTRGSGPKHDQVFTAEVSLGDEQLGKGLARTKREAERLAAEEALAVLEAREQAVHGPEAAADDVDFEGPWPVFEDLLSQTLAVADSRLPKHLTGEEARVAVRDFSLSLYKELLLNLGDIVDDDEDDDQDNA